VSAPAETGIVVALLALAAGIRWLRWERTEAIFNDGPRFLAMAERMAADDWSSALGHDYHPLYPFLTAMASFVVGEMETAAVLVSVIGGVIAVGCIYGLARDTFEWPVAPIAGLLLAVHPRAVDFTSDVQSEGVYLAAFLAALWLGWRACRDRAPALAAWAGALSGLAYLARPEGIGAILVAASLAVWFVVRRRWTLPQGLGWAAAAFAGMVLVMGPYLGLLRVQGGTWSLTRKKSVSVVAGLPAASEVAEPVAPPPDPAEPAAPAVLPAEEPAPVDEPEGDAEPATDAEAQEPAVAGDGAVPEDLAEAAPAAPAVDPGVDRLESYARLAADPDNNAVKRRNSVAAFRELLTAMTRAFRFEVLVLLLLGLVHLRGPPTDRGLFYGALVLIFGIVLVGLAWNFGYVSRRHVLPIAAALLGYAAVGVIVAARLVHDAYSGSRLPWSDRAARRATAATIITLLMVPPLVELSGVRREDKRAGRLAAQWLQDEVPQRGGLAAHRGRLAYYADASFVAIPDLPAGPDPTELRERGATHLILEVDDITAESWDRLLAQPGVQVLQRFDHAGHEAVLIDLGSQGGS
jgi:4-amino-4-deoxy-L-arabinose transferase-like glycosyltransferase